MTQSPAEFRNTSRLVLFIFVLMLLFACGVFFLRPTPRVFRYLLVGVFLGTSFFTSLRLGIQGSLRFCRELSARVWSHLAMKAVPLNLWYVAIFFLWTLKILVDLAFSRQMSTHGLATGWLFVSSLIYAASITLWSLALCSLLFISSQGRKIHGALLQVLGFLHIDHILFASQKFHLTRFVSYVWSGHFNEAKMILKFSGVPMLLEEGGLLAFFGLFFVGQLVFSYGRQTRFAFEISFNRFRLLIVGLLVAPALFFEQLISASLLSAKTWENQQESILAYPTWLKPNSTLLSLQAKGKALNVAGQSAAELPNLKAPVSTNDSHIFIVILETFRGDFVDAQTTPRLARISAEDSIQFTRAFSNGNATSFSWFSIFQSLYPHRKADAETRNAIFSRGSDFLRILKQQGYAIHVSSASHLGWDLNQNYIFGPDQYLANDFFNYQEGRAWERDRVVLDSLLEKVQVHGKHLYVLFLDSSHLPYEFPPYFKIPFSDYSGILDFEHFQPKPSRRVIELIQNRYRNSMAFVDHSIGRLEDGLKKIGLYDKSIMVITGDHGEEFFEQGMYGHNFHLYDEILRPPLLIKIPGAPRAIKSLVTHVDILPTVFGALKLPLPNYPIDGLNLLSKTRRTAASFCEFPMKVSSDFRMSLQNERVKLIGDWVNSTGQGELRIREVRDSENVEWHPQDISAESVRQHLLENIDLSESELQFMSLDLSSTLPGK